MKADLTINIRPVRHIYFISENDLERFVEVASYCCTQWGGSNNLIIPIQFGKDAQDMPLYIHSYNLFLISLRQPDTFVDAISDRMDDSLIRDSFKNYFASQFPGHSLYEWSSFIQYDDTFHPLNILSSQNDFSKPEIAIAEFPLNSSLPRTHLDNAIIAAGFGRIWPDQKEAYEEAYTFNGWDSSDPGRFLLQQLLVDPYASVINLTSKDLHNIGTENSFPSLYFDIVVVQKVWDLCRFWNLRSQSFGHVWLTDRRVLILSKEQLLQEQGAYYKPLIQLIKERRIHRHIESNVDVFFHHNHDQEIHEFLESQSELQQHEGSIHSSIHNEREANNANVAKPLIYGENSSISTGPYYEFGGNRPTFSQELITGSETFLVPSAGPRTGGAQRAFIGLQSNFWFQYPNHPSVASLIVSNSSFSKLLDTVQLNYSLYLTPQGLERITLNIPQTWQIYQAFFQSKGYVVTPSDKKAYADGLLRMVGGLDDQKALILRSRISREILDILSDKASDKLAQALIRQLGLQTDQRRDLQQVIANLGVLPQNQRFPKAFGDIFSHIRNIPELTNCERKRCLQDLAKLVGIKVVQRGMYVKCPHCGTAMWYGINALDERIRCNGCLEIFDLPLIENDNDSIERPFQYSLNPLANRAMDQDVLPVIAALLALKAYHAVMHHVVMGMNFQKMGNTDQDGDFDFVYTYKQGLYGGECKSGGKFNIKDINTAKIAQSLGFRAFFFAAMRPIEAESQILIDEYKQELADNKDDDHPFDVFVLDDRMLFGETSLPNNIP